MSRFQPPSSRCARSGRLQQRARAAARILALLLVAASAMLPVHAQSCWIGQSLDIAFGVVDGSGKSTSNSLSVTCNRGSGSPALAYRICMFIPEGSPIPGINPRWMTNYNGAQMAYDLYADPAHSQLIPPTPGSSGYVLHSTVLSVQTNTGAQASVTLPVHARVRAGQTLPATYGFQSQIGGGRIRYVYNSGSPGNAPTAPSPEQCLAGTAAETTFYTHVSATFANTCRITTATDLDFGAVTALAGNRDQTSTIQLQCPTGTPWRLGLDDGNHAVGTTRRMAGPNGSHLRYELYRDPQRTQRWGGKAIATDNSIGAGTNATQSLTVYGRVPAQPTPVPGSYADTVTITLTY
ncbi:spore coat protein U domain-containing protein [Luteimonas sp. MC1572]|uniref:Csu type fimbrial protein n=1 Tax=Luteimonas sp. MC1572 TaxID=2799325 RepID=UPI0018F0F810|nr:spore coat protein U domain-containing protein [Luteimonas sp. MC1572]MBJ6980467.1 spore coat protein U domain-containing protein [Luteimonas sp. MC1572]QQO04346.1 spore coat protein U domain-containing protein [Luteimonas sp. MC1572]